MLTDTYYPGWKAYINNKEEPILLADGIFRAVVVPHGKSVVDFIFQSKSFKIGSIISLSSLFLILFLISLIGYSKTQK